jgi:hypothetical protein
MHHGKFNFNINTIAHGRKGMLRHTTQNAIQPNGPNKIAKHTKMIRPMAGFIQNQTIGLK